MKIIIVDDEISALTAFLSEIIDEKELDCRFFRDNETEVLSYAVKNEVAAAFLDVNMPGINGVELARKLIRVNRDIKIVFITGLNLEEKNLDDEVRKNTVGFVYKPYDTNELNRILPLIKNATPRLVVRMFGAFDCFIGNQIVRFSSNKSKELFALLLSYRGKSLTMTDAISQLWPDYDLEKAKILYRDAVWRLRKTLDDIGFPCVTFQRALLILKPENIDCDFWNYIMGVGGNYEGEFLKSYDWSIGYLAALDKIRKNRNK